MTRTLAWLLCLSASPLLAREPGLGPVPAMGPPAVLKTFVSDVSYPAHLPYPQFTDVNGTLFFRANDGSGCELWKSDGTPQGTVLVKDINPSSTTASCTSLAELTEVEGRVFFQADDGIHGQELWKSDGTPQGTVMVKDIRPGPALGLLNALAHVNADGTFFFCANDGVHGYELWKSDGTEAGTVLVKDISPGPNSGGPTYIRFVDGVVYFNGLDHDGDSLWRSDGTEAGTYKLKAALWALPYNAPFVSVGGQVLFVAKLAGEPEYAEELWTTDGTPAGTRLLKDIRPGPEGSFPRGLTLVDGVVYFSADDGVHGNELWRSDGTEAGTYLVADAEPGPGPSFPGNLVEAGRLLWFAPAESLHGRELWRSDGTPAGTAIVRDVLPGPPGGTPGPFVNAAGALVFGGYDGGEAYGDESWVSDGTSAGTHVLFDLAPGPAHTFPREFARAGRWVYHSTPGSKLWAFPLLVPTLSVSDASLSEGDATVRELLFSVTLSEPSDRTVIVDYATRDSSAKSGSDYVATSGELTFPPGTLSRTIRVGILADRIHEQDERFALELSNAAHAALADRKALGRIQDDDAPGFSIEDVVVSEGRQAPSRARFRVTLSPTAATDTSVEFATADGTATADADYVPRSGVLAFSAGTATLPVDLDVLPDALLEGRETFDLVLSNASGGPGIAHAVGQGTVRDPWAGGDFDGDRHSDIPWRHMDSGGNVLWLMNGVELAQAGFTEPSQLADLNWRIVGTADFDGDGRSDLLWHHALSGKTVVWFMNGFTRTSGALTVPAGVPDTRWRLAATGDFDADGKADLLWRHADSGKCVVWFMNGPQRTGATYLFPEGLADPRWGLVGAADFDTDGHTDLLWRNRATGGLSLWFLRGVARVAVSPTQPSGLLDLNWEPMGVADFNDDDRPDILWRHAVTGRVVVWFMDGRLRIGGSFTNPAQVDVRWRIVGPR